MSQRRFVGAAVVGLIVIVLLIAGASAFRRSAWEQGYMMGRLSGGEEGAVMPYAPYSYPGRHSGFSSALCGLPFLGIGLFFMFLLMMGKAFRFHAWKRVGGPPDERWEKHWRRFHTHKTPWCWWGDEEPAEEKADKAQPDSEATDDESEA